jgi:formamidopyrimidine-DNA glycosylase
MPELPEVEVTRQALAAEVEGGVIGAIAVRDRRLRWPVPRQLARTLAGRRVLAMARRGKYLLWQLDGGTLISHLGMSGSWRVFRGVAPAPQPHDHVDIDVAVAGRAPAIIRFTDPRRFGALLWQAGAATAVERHALLRRLGLEPFDTRFDGTILRAGFAGRRQAVKQALLAGDVVVGVGNIYASESLFRAGIDPRIAAGRVSAPRCERLAGAIRAVLAEAIERGGSTLRDYTGADGRAGEFIQSADVYERGGQPCRRCGAPIRRIVQGARATYFCPHCQRR